MIATRIVPDTWISVHAMLGLEGEERQAGHTSHQMREAPEGAYFVWCNDNTCYAKDLARELGRTDLKVVGHYWLSANEAMYSPHRLPIVIDHALSVVMPR